MATYLIDVNLPYYFSPWNNSDYQHQLDIQNNSEDYEIWQYAKERSMTIVTKDSDFSDRILFSNPPPRVIHLRVGNVSMRDFHRIVGSIWDEVKVLSTEYKLVTVFKDKIEAVN